MFAILSLIYNCHPFGKKKKKKKKKKNSVKMQRRESLF